MLLKNGTTSVKTRLVLKSSSTGIAVTGLTTASSGLVISLIADTEATGTAYSGSNIETITTCGTYAAPTSGKVLFKEVDATNHPGVYEIQAADARWAVSGAQAVIVSINATGVLSADKEVELVAFNPQDASALGLSNLDAAVSSRLASSSYTAPDNVGIALIEAKTNNLPAAPAAVGDIPTAVQNADTLLDRTNAVETGWTVRNALRIVLSALGGVSDGAGTSTVTVEDVTGTKTRITASVDLAGNVTAVTLDAA